MGSSGRMEGTSWVTLSLKSGLEPTRESPLGLCTAGRRRPWEALPGGKRGVSVLRHPGPTLSHTVLRKGAVQDTKPLSMLTPPPGLPHLLNPAQPPLWTLPPSHESQGLSLGFLLPLYCTSWTLTGSLGSAGWRPWPSSASAVAWSRAAQKCPD